LESGQIGFKNEMHRAFVYYAMSEESRKFYHLQLTAHEQESSTHFQTTLERGHHLLRAGLEGQAAQVATEGARSAIAEGGAVEAERFLREILTFSRTPAPPAAHVVLASALVAQGAYDAALHALAAIEDEDLDPPDAALQAIVRAESYHRSGIIDDPKNAELAKVALQKATSLEDRSCLLRALQVAAEVASETLDTLRVQEIQGIAFSIAQTASDIVVRARANITQGFCALVRAEHLKALSAFREAAKVLRERTFELDLRHALAGMGICFTNIGHYDEAEAVLLEGVDVARRLRNKVFEAVLWNNIAVIYDDLGMFGRSVQAYREGCRLLGDSTTSRQRSRIFSNVAGLAVSLGNHDEAMDLLDRAEKTARASGSLSVLVGVLLGHTDLWLALGENDRAWETFGQIMTLTNGKAPLGGATGQYERLRRQYVWATAGHEAVKRLRSFDEAEGLVKGLASQLEVRATEEWIEAQESGSNVGRFCNAVVSILDHNLFGVLTRLIAVGIRPHTLPPCRNGESPATLVQRLYADRIPGPVPVGVLDD